MATTATQPPPFVFGIAHRKSEQNRNGLRFLGRLCAGVCLDVARSGFLNTSAFWAVC